MNLFVKSRASGISKFILCLFICFSLLSKPSSVNAGEITNIVRETIEAITKIVSDKELKKKKNRAKKRAMLRNIIGSRFNYEEMSRISLSKFWNDRTREEKKEFVKLFGRLLESSYSKKIENYTNEKILYVEEKIKGDKALVKTKIIQGDDKIPVNYKLIKTSNGWMVYDFIVEGVSMVKNYRSQFKKIILKSSYEELLKKLKNKLGKISD